MRRIITLFSLTILVSLSNTGQLETLAAESATASSQWTMPRTEYGRPDFQGNWFFGSRTPLQRPTNLGDKQTYTPEEARELEQRMMERLERQDAPLDPDRGAPEIGARIGQEADDAFLGHYLEPKLHQVNGEYRTSVITGETSGRIPRREGFQDFYAKRRASGLADTDGPEGQPLSGRCLIFGAAAPSLTPMMMNPNLQIVQTENYLMVMTEMIHDARIIRIGGEHFSHDIPQWMGDAVARWEDDTLVVHSKNYRPEQSSSRSIVISEDFELIERYTLVGDNEIHYAFTVTDDQAYTQAFSGERILSRNSPEEKVYEFACHEGNYSLPGILAGARRLESEQE
ncbi:MAG: hypothetical protein GKR91_08715 [Pseudomonadales bacterium]|nr:hypothetical protein [Pseudomonadales bacterium]